LRMEGFSCAPPRTAACVLHAHRIGVPHRTLRCRSRLARCTRGARFTMLRASAAQHNLCARIAAIALFAACAARARLNAPPRTSPRCVAAPAAAHLARTAARCLSLCVPASLRRACVRTVATVFAHAHNRLAACACARCTHALRRCTTSLYRAARALCIAHAAYR